MLPVGLRVKRTEVIFAAPTYIYKERVGSCCISIVSKHFIPVSSIH